jgi:hypothetical protein
MSEIFDSMPAPSGKFGVWPRNDGGIHLAFYHPDGTPAATVDLDMAASAEFWVAVNQAVRQPVL